MVKLYPYIYFGGKMIPKKIQIAEGITLTAVQTDKFKSSLITFTVNLPLTKKNIAYNMLLTSVLKRGTRSYPSLAAINKRLDELYSTSLDIRSARIGKNLTMTIICDVLDPTYIPPEENIFEGVLEIVKEIIQSPNFDNGLFPQNIVEQEKRFLTDSLNSVINNTRAYASVRLHEICYRTDSEFPTIEELKSAVEEIDERSITEFYRNIWTGSSLSIFYIGSADTEALTRDLRKYFSPWNMKTTTPVIMPFAEQVCSFVSKTEKMPVSQGKLAMSFKTGVCVSNADRIYALTVLNEIFGASPASKLFLNVREKLSLCYFCSSSLDSYTGVITVSAGIENKNREIATRAIIKEFEDIKNGNISDFELTAAKRSIINGIDQICDSPYDLQSFYGNRSFFGNTEDISSLRNGILSVTAEQIEDVAKSTVLDSIFFVEGDKSMGETEDDCDE